MNRSEEQNKKAKETIKAAWAEGDLWGLFCAGIDNFMSMLLGGGPISFRRFLEYTGKSFDQYIRRVSREEGLRYIGGKLILELGQEEAAAPDAIRLSADLYFQTEEKQWIVKKKTGAIGWDQFSDRDTDPELKRLKDTGRLELSIEPPETGEE